MRPEGLPQVYSGTLIFFLVPAYFLTKRIPLRERIAHLLLCLLLCFCFCFNIADLVWHGFQAPNWLNYRYSYMLVFLLILLSAKAFHDPSKKSKLPHIVSGGLLGIFTVLSVCFGGENITLLGTLLPTMLCIALYTPLLLRRASLPSEKRTKRLSCILLCVVCTELFFAGLYNTVSLDSDVVISARPTYTALEETYGAAMDHIQENDRSPFFRVEKGSYRMVNDSFTLGYRGLSGSTSTLNKETVLFLDNMGYLSEFHTSRYMGSTPVADMLLGVKYFMAEDTITASTLYEKVYEDDKISLYQNPFALSVAYAVDDRAKYLTWDELAAREDDSRILIYDSSPIERLNLLSAALAGDGLSPVYTPLKHTVALENCEFSSSRIRIFKTDMEKEAFATFSFTVPKESEIYMHIPTYRYGETEFTVNETEFGAYFSKNRHGYVCLGCFAEGETVSVKFKIPQDGIHFYDTDYFYSLNSMQLQACYDALKPGEFQIQDCEEDYFAGEITVSEGKTTILTTIPYDKGWQVTSDGESVSTYKILDALLGFDLPIGTHTLTLRYMPKEYPIACILSLAGWLILGTIWIAEKAWHKKQNSIKGERKL